MSNAKLQPVLDRIDADFDNSLERLFALLRIKSISADPAFAGDCKAAADHLAKDIATLGFATEVRPTAGHPAIVAKSQWQTATARPHVLFYGHYDVQPVDPLNLWHRPPFEPVVTDHADGRKIIVARGAEDDKGQLMTFVEACRAWKAVTGSLPLDLTILIEGEEEVGSKNFVPFLEANKEELKADFALVCDTGMWDPNTPAITTSLRGLVYDEVKIKAANRDLHSGVFGGGAQNPIRVLTRILGGLHDDNGHITIPGFYDGVKDLPPDILAQWKKLNLTPETFLKPIGLSIPAGEKDRLLIEQVSSRPTCDINGIVGGYTGEGSKTVIPAEASAKVSFRLVEGQDPQKIRKAFRDYVTARLPGDCTAEFIDHSSAPAIALDWNMKPLAAAKRALTDEWGKEALLIGSGASIPIVADFKRTLGLDSVLVGFGLDDDNIHSPNEKYDLKSFHKGIRSWARILGALAELSAEASVGMDVICCRLPRPISLKTVSRDAKTPPGIGRRFDSGRAEVVGDDSTRETCKISILVAGIERSSLRSSGGQTSLVERSSARSRIAEQLRRSCRSRPARPDRRSGPACGCGPASCRRAPDGTCARRRRRPSGRPSACRDCAAACGSCRRGPSAGAGARHDRARCLHSRDRRGRG